MIYFLKFSAIIGINKRFRKEVVPWKLLHITKNHSVKLIKVLLSQKMPHFGVPLELLLDQELWCRWLYGPW